MRRGDFRSTGSSSTGTSTSNARRLRRRRFLSKNGSVVTPVKSPSSLPNTRTSGGTGTGIGTVVLAWSSNNSVNSKDTIEHDDDDDEEEEEEEDDWGSKTTTNRGIPLKRRRALFAVTPNFSAAGHRRRSFRKPLAKIEENPRQENVVVVEQQQQDSYRNQDRITIVDSQGFPIPPVVPQQQEEEHQDESFFDPVEEPDLDLVTKSSFGKARKDSVRVMAQPEGDVLLLQVADEEAVEVVSLFTNEEEERLRQEDDSGREEQEDDKSTVFLPFTSSPQDDDENGNENEEDSTRMPSGTRDKYHFLLEEESAGLLGENPSPCRPASRPYPSGFFVSKNYNSEEKVDDMCSVQTESTGILRRDKDDESKCLSVQSKDTSRASTMSRLFSYTPLHRRTTMQSEATSQRQDNDQEDDMDEDGSTDDTDGDDDDGDDDGGEDALESASVYSMFSEVTSDSFSTSASNYTLSWRSSMMSTMKPLNLSVSEDFKEMAKEVTRNPIVLAQWLNPL